MTSFTLVPDTPFYSLISRQRFLSFRIVGADFDGTQLIVEQRESDGSWERVQTPVMSADTDWYSIVMPIGKSRLRFSIVGDGTFSVPVDFSEDIVPQNAVFETGGGEITGGDIKTLYEAEADTNAFTDAEQTLLGNQSGVNTGDQDLSAYQLEPTEGAFVDGDKTKLDGIETAATADQTGAEIKSAYEAESDTNAFSDADVTTLANALQSGDVTSATLDSGVSTDGQVLTSDGAGNALWEDPTGGGGETTETSLYIDAGALFAKAGEADAVSTEGTNNAVDEWNVATGETLYAKTALPPQWDGGDLEVEVLWSSSGGTAAENIMWGVAAQCAGDDDVWDTAFSATDKSADDPIINNTDIHSISITGVTPSGTPADGDLLFLEIVRETAGATASSHDAQLLGIRVIYQNTLLQNWYVTKMGTEADDTSGTGEKSAWIVPAAGKIHEVHSGCSTVTAGGALTVDVQKDAVSILGTKGIIDSTEDTTSTGTAHVLTTTPTAIAAGDKLTFHVDTFGGSGAKGLHTDLLISWD